MNGNGEGPGRDPALVKANMKISVVTATYNRPELLYRMLYSLWMQKYPNYEVMVSIDDDKDMYPKSETVVREFMEKQMPIRYFNTAQFKKGGDGFSAPSYPYNVGIRYSTGDIILLCGSEVISVTRTLSQHIHKHQGYNNNVIFATVHALSIEMQKKIDTYPWKERPASLLFKGSCTKMYTGYGKSYTNTYEIEDAAVPYHFMVSLRREHLIRIGGFDEDFYGLMAAGDDDIAGRLRRLHMVFKWDSQIIAIHQFHRCPENLTKKGRAKTNPEYGSGQQCCRVKANGDIVRNKGKTWGWYPRHSEDYQ